jgi:hypothetical protein
MLLTCVYYGQPPPGAVKYCQVHFCLAATRPASTSLAMDKGLADED